MPSYQYPFATIAIDIGGTKIAAALLCYTSSDCPPKVMKRQRIATEAHQGGQYVLKRVTELAQTLLNQATLDTHVPLLGIGVASAGRVSAIDGSIAYANDLMPGWTGIPLKAHLEHECRCAVTVLGDVQSHALGEACFGAAQGAQTCIVMAPGTGLGGAFIAHGRIVRGAHGFAGEIGATPSTLDFGENLEAVASGSGIQSCYQALSGKSLDGAGIAQRATTNDDIHARQTIEQAGRALGLALAGWTNMLDPDCAVLSGSVTRAGSLWRNALQEAFVSHVPEVLADLPIYDACLGDDAPLIGASQYLLDVLKGSE